MKSDDDPIGIGDIEVLAEMAFGGRVVRNAEPIERPCEGTEPIRTVHREAEHREPGKCRGSLSVAMQADRQATRVSNDDADDL